MTTTSIESSLEHLETRPLTTAPNWVTHARQLWQRRRLLVWVMFYSLLVGLAIAFLIPKQYVASTRIMPPEQQGSGALVLAALSARTGGAGGLGSLASGLLGAHSSSALFIDLLRSGTIASQLIQRFQLQHVYRTRYLVDTAKHLARSTKITEDKKSGTVLVEVEDTDPVRARDLAQAYLDELNKLVNQTSTSSAHQERLFIERRLHAVKDDLEKAQLALGEFSSRNSTIDIQSQTRAMVDAASKLQAQVLVEQAGLASLRQIYGDDNVRVRGTAARIASLEHELAKLSGSSAPLTSAVEAGTESDLGSTNALYPPLRQLPRLAVPYADLYRRVKVQETVFELLTQQYELARIEEAKDVPVVSVIDPPGVPEKKSFPPRLLLALGFMTFSFVSTAAGILMRIRWQQVDMRDPRKQLAQEVLTSLRRNGGAA